MHEVNLFNALSYYSLLSIYLFTTIIDISSLQLVFTIIQSGLLVLGFFLVFGWTPLVFSGMAPWSAWSAWSAWSNLVMVGAIISVWLMLLQLLLHKWVYFTCFWEITSLMLFSNFCLSFDLFWLRMFLSIGSCLVLLLYNPFTYSLSLLLLVHSHLISGTFSSYIWLFPIHLFFILSILYSLRTPISLWQLLFSLIVSLFITWNSP